MRIPSLGRIHFILSIFSIFLALPARAADVELELETGGGFSVKNNGAAIERFRVDEATGNISRNGALFVHTTGSSTFVGQGAGNTSMTGSYNSAVGRNTLLNNTTGVGNSAFGHNALFSNTTGDSNSAFGSNALNQNTEGFANSAFGSSALNQNTSGYGNSALGSGALLNNSTGKLNSAFGRFALLNNDTGDSNSAFGTGALSSNTADRNSAFGTALGLNTTGSGNIAFGHLALNANTSGNSNVALGTYAGLGQTTGSDNIYLANAGVAAESGKIKIGNAAHTETFIEGIDGNVATGGVTVLINSSNELHTLVSSIRFKREVRDMGETSELLMALRPVVFRYREEVAEGGAVQQYGLIAEAVAEVAPELVTLDAEGEPYSVRYHVLPSLLLNEVQKHQRTIASLVGRLEAVESELERVQQEANR